MVCILGPTGVGKTFFSLEIAEALSGEIVSADSMQVYRGMDIGTAKASPEERDRIPHHCLDLVSVREEYSVARYQEDARKAIADIHQRDKIPIMVGGTGLYIQAALEPYDFSSAGKDLELREQLWKEMEQQGKTHLWNRLREVDSCSAEKLHENDTRRVVRALEAYYKTGIPLSVAEKNTLASDPIYKVFYLGFQRERSQLYQRIDQRVEEMMRGGLSQEVHQLIEQGLEEDSIPGQALGYKEFFPYFRGERTQEETIAVLQRNTRRYAKRQMTWFRRMSNIHWIDLEAFGDMCQAKTSLVDLIRENL
jgi:tRNA dimethylallyltransferase